MFFEYQRSWPTLRMCVMLVRDAEIRFFGTTAAFCQRATMVNYKQTASEEAEVAF